MILTLEPLPAHHERITPTLSTSEHWLSTNLCVSGTDAIRTRDAKLRRVTIEQAVAVDRDTTSVSDAVKPGATHPERIRLAATAAQHGFLAFLSVVRSDALSTRNAEARCITVEQAVAVLGDAALSIDARQACLAHCEAIDVTETAGRGWRCTYLAVCGADAARACDAEIERAAVNEARAVAWDAAAVILTRQAGSAHVVGRIPASSARLKRFLARSSSSGTDAASSGNAGVRNATVEHAVGSLGHEASARDAFEAVAAHHERIPVVAPRAAVDRADAQLLRVGSFALQAGRAELGCSQAVTGPFNTAALVLALQAGRAHPERIGLAAAIHTHRLAAQLACGAAGAYSAGDAKARCLVVEEAVAVLGDEAAVVDAAKAGATYPVRIRVTALAAQHWRLALAVVRRADAYLV